MDEVLITGMGVITCFGGGVDSFWEGMMGASSSPRKVNDPNADMAIPLMYTVPDASVPLEGSLPGFPQLGSASRYALDAAQQAVADARLEGVDPERIAVVLGTGMGDADRHEEWRVHGAPGDGAPGDGDRSPVFDVASAVGAHINALGPNTSVSNACAASGFSLPIAADLIRSGAADVVVSGGAEGYSRVALGCFNRLGAVDPHRCRPFDSGRQGTVFGEGAAVLVLESAGHHARRRGAPRVYARLAGEGWSCDAHHTTAMHPEGEQMARAMVQAMAQARVAPEEVGCVLPHGTGTVLNDTLESKLLSGVVPHAPLYSLKSLIGHTGGSAGAMAALAAALFLHRGTVPPNVLRDEPDPECE